MLKKNKETKKKRDGAREDSATLCMKSVQSASVAFLFIGRRN